LSFQKTPIFTIALPPKKEPYKLLHVKTGNIKNSQLIELFDKNLELIVKELDESAVVQISQNYIIKIQQ